MEMATLALHGVRKEHVAVPPNPSLTSTTPSTVLYFVSDPLPESISSLEIAVVSRAQGPLDDSESASFAWFEVSILRPWHDEAEFDFDNLKNTFGLKVAPGDFGDLLQDLGWYFAPIPKDFDGNTNIAHRCRWDTATRNLRQYRLRWYRDQKRVALNIFGGLQEGDRIAIWARAQSPGWVNNVYEVRISLSLAQQSLEDTPSGYPDRATWLNNLAVDHYERFRREGQIDDLKNALQRIKQSLDLTTESDPSRASRIHSHGAILQLQFQRTGQIINLQNAIRCFHQSVDITPVADKARTTWLHSLGAGYYNLFHHTGEIEDLEKSILYFQKSLDSIPHGHGEKAERIHSLGVALAYRFQTTGRITDLEQSIQYCQQSLDATPEDHLDRPTRIHSLGSGLQERFKTNGQMVDLNDAIRYFEQVLETAPGHHPEQAVWLSSLGSALHSRFHRTSRIEDLENAIQRFQQSLDANPNDTQRKAARIHNVGTGLYDRFELTGHMADLESAIKYFERALEASSSDHPDRAVWLHSLGAAFRGRLQRTGQSADADSAVRYLQQSVEATSRSHPERHSRIHSLGVGFRSRYQRTGQTQDLDNAIKCFQQALEGVPNDYTDRAVWLNSLGAGLHDRFRRIGQLTDLNDAIQYSQLSLDATLTDHPDRVVWMHALGTLFYSRFQRLGQMADIDNAIRYIQQSLQATSEDHHVDRAARIYSLGVGFRHRFQRTGQIADLDNAIQSFQQSLDDTSDDHPDRAVRIHSIGLALRDRYQRTKQLSEIESAVKYLQQSLKVTPPDHPGRAVRLHSVGVGYHEQYRTAGRMDYLAEAIEHFRESLNATPDDHPDRALRCQALGVAFGDLFDVRGLGADRDRACDFLGMALASSLSNPLIRVNAGMGLLGLLIRAKRWTDCKQTIDAMLQLLPEVTPRSSSRLDLQHTLRQLSGLASVMASVLHKAGASPLESLQALEQSRGIIASLMMDTRSDITLLKQDHPDLWSRLRRCREEIANTNEEGESLSVEGAPLDYAQRTVHRQQLFQTLDEIHVEIRKKPGFERFLLAPTDEEIRDLAQDGPLVCFNISGVSNEAFIVTKDGIEVLDLPSIKQGSLAHQLRLFGLGGNAARRDAEILEEEGENSPQDESAETLSLWNIAVKPVFDHLGFREPALSTDDLPRIWWIGGGIMSLLPLHAAGDHSPGSTNNTLSHAVSSYAVSLKSLKFLKRKSELSSNKHRILVVAMPETPGIYKDLQVDQEARAIQKHAESLAAVTVLRKPDKASVLQAIRSCTVAHFACHGIADAVEPAKSALVLGKTTQEKLMVEDIDKVMPENAQIAYLSACSTAEVKTRELADEGIHLASTFQLAGFQHVIGTLWGADDDAAVEIASKFYEGFLSGTSKSVAHALHESIISFRRKGVNMTEVLKWAPFVHLGR